MRLLLTAAFCLSLTPAFAGVEEVIEDHALPGTAAFAQAAAALDTAARADCTAPSLRPAYQKTFDAWLGIAHLSLGPLEEAGRGLTIGFWPDSRGMVGRTVAKLIADKDPAAQTPEGFAEVSVAGRGLFALERVLYDDALAGYAEGSYSCTLARAMTHDLAVLAREVDTEWREGFAQSLRSAGADGNTRFLSEREAVQALYTALSTGLEFIADQRLGRPMGTFDAPKPRVAEARRSGRSLRNVILSLEALRGLARSLSDAPIPQTEAAFAAALDKAEILDDPVFAGVADPVGRLRVEALQTLVSKISSAVAQEIAPALGVSVGFNATDGD
ncbi:imelysin family protein [Sulfitobacter sp. S0837]|uniref:imelysin family protein n=1 Tax=Sulfitobacter maritimus TaxID=2741719 RepID=UPI001582980D|nr:imelysin family protein [Sulfitobacter maritimus]NUH67145.1 imelysin family protein [Sulfitobacter maritimus]